MSPQPAIPTPGVGFGRDTQHLPPGFRLLPSAPLPHRPLHRSYSPGFLCPLLPRPCWGGSSGHRGGRAALTPERCRSLCPREGSSAAAGRGSRGRPLSASPGGAAGTAPRPARLGRAGQRPWSVQVLREGNSQPTLHPQLLQPRGHHRDWRLGPKQLPSPTGSALGTGQGSDSEQSTETTYRTIFSH